MTGKPTIYDHHIIDANDNKVPMTIFKNKVLIIVNTATLCGFTPQFKELEQLYQKYQDQGLVILAFPCNQFNWEDPRPIHDSINEVRSKYNVTYPILNKVVVNSIDDDGDALYKFLKREKPMKLGFQGILWNFVKFVVARDGRVVQRFSSLVPPSLLEPLIEALLQEPQQ